MLDLHGAAHYCIVVQGTLDPAWFAQLDDLTTLIRPGPPQHTVLSGRLRDQAALHGVLRTLYTLGLPLVSVALVRPEEDNHA
jgi:hypothetical protein